MIDETELIKSYAGCSTLNSCALSFKDQYGRVRRWVEKSKKNVDSYLICEDFYEYENINSDGYSHSHYVKLSELLSQPWFTLEDLIYIDPSTAKQLQ